MPELPEVVTVTRILNQEIQGKKIVGAKIIYPKLLVKTSLETLQNGVKNQTILRVYNLAKYIIFELEETVLVSHLRMEGRWGYETPTTFSYPQNLLEAQFFLDNGFVLSYYDFRRFGTLELVKKEDFWKTNGGWTKIGPVANDPDLTPAKLFDLFKKVKKPVKTALLDQNLVSGIGNIYANEILFAAKINPWTPTNRLNEEEWELICQQTQKILNTAIACGGTTIHSFAPKLGLTGSYQKFLQVHGREGQKCFSCQMKIKKVTIGGRGTYFCPVCQSRVFPHGE